LRKGGRGAKTQHHERCQASNRHRHHRSAIRCHVSSSLVRGGTKPVMDVIARSASSVADRIGKQESSRDYSESEFGLFVTGIRATGGEPGTRAASGRSFECFPKNS
jgi:hypothetical protein